MKNLALVLMFSLMVVACTNQTVQSEQYLEDSRKTAQSFMQKLGGELQRQIKTGGVESAIPVCKQIAPAIADEYSQGSKLVKRVSTKPRNTKQGNPDQWELNALQGFEAAIKTDPAAINVEKNEVVTGADGQYYRYAKAIRIKPLCLSCHGQEKDIQPNVRAILAQHYPNDVATGYQLGDLRGAISIKQKLNP
jgi:hypothetical protein